MVNRTNRLEEPSLIPDRNNFLSNFTYFTCKLWITNKTLFRGNQWVKSKKLHLIECKWNEKSCVNKKKIIKGKGPICFMHYRKGSIFNIQAEVKNETFFQITANWKKKNTHNKFWRSFYDILTPLGPSTLISSMKYEAW
jgi:hypothetical protein